MNNLAVAYCRVSTKNQEDSIKDQQEQWEDIIQKEDYIFANTGVFYKKKGEKEERRNGLYVDEGISAKEYQKYRQAFIEMIKDGLQGKFSKIFVEDVTRFARNVEDGMKVIKDLREKGVGVKFRKEGLDSIDVKNDMVLGVLFSVAEQEIKTDSARFKWRIDKLHRAGMWTSHPPYGYIMKEPKSGILLVKEDEAEVVKFIYRLYVKTSLGTRSIANLLNERGFKTKKGNLWKATSVRYILVNHLYIGDMITHKTESYDITRGTYKRIPEEEQIKIHKEELRIIDDETWEEKEKIMNKRKAKLKTGEGDSSKHLLSSLMYCESCGSVFIRSRKKIRKKKNGKIVGGEYEWGCLGHHHYRRL